MLHKTQEKANIWDTNCQDHINEWIN